MSFKDILGTIPTLQSVGLLGRNIEFAKKGKSVVKTGITNLIAIPLISKTADLIKGL